MKNAKDLAINILACDSSGKIVEWIADIGEWKKLPSPQMSTEISCVVCSGIAHWTPFCDPAKNLERVWICANLNCKTNSKENQLRATYIPPISKRAILWPLFCEYSGIGDVHHDIKFESIKQSDAKISYLLKFAEKPQGIILMRGDPGTGKTYAALATCELYTRKDTSCLFNTQKQMFTQWLEIYNNKTVTNFLEKVNNVTLLVIDDFGTGEVSPGFMTFFMDLINTRLQWTNRGTIITTNLDVPKFNAFCGEALADRIMTGQQFEFKGNTRRKKIIL